MNYKFSNYIKETNQLDILYNIPKNYLTIVGLTFQNYFHNNFKLLAVNNHKTDKQATNLFNKELRRITYEQNFDRDVFTFSFSYHLFQKVQFKITITIKSGVIYSELFMTKYFFVEKCCRKNIDMMTLSRLVKNITLENFKSFTFYSEEKIQNINMYAPAPIENLKSHIVIDSIHYDVYKSHQVGDFEIDSKFNYYNADLDAIFHNCVFGRYFFKVVYKNDLKEYSSFLGGPVGLHSINVTDQVLQLLNEFNISILDLNSEHFDLITMMEY